MTQNDIKYPKIKIQLSGEDGNAFFILAKCCSAMEKAGLGKEVIDEFRQEAKSGDYNHLLRTVMKWFKTK
jgi:hypothetical protein